MEDAAVSDALTVVDPLEAEYLAERRTKDLQRAAKDEKALAAIEHSKMLRKGRQVALRALDALAELLEDPEKAKVWLTLQGPAGLANITKLFEAVNRETRLDNGQATEHIAVAAFDAARLTPEERAALRKGMLRAQEEGDGE